MSPMVVDVAIIGAGFSGSLLALMLHQVGRKVVLLERGQHPASCARRILDADDEPGA